MEKATTFSNEEKSLIWSRFIKPANGTQEEAAHFIQVCEQFGLNPLLGDIVFQRYETKRGAKTQFITTRDGLLRVSTRQPSYVGPPNANVVKEGDDFEFIPSEGSVKHKFGSKRGEILGAYAIMKHKKHNPVAVFVDFDEYYQANSGKINSRYGNENVWDKMPSAMIVKIAEVFVLRRQFPLGGLYTQEEMGLNETVQKETEQPTVKADPKPEKQEKPVTETKKESNSSQPEQQESNRPQMREMVVQAFETKVSASQAEYGILTAKDTETNKKVIILVKKEVYIKQLKHVEQGVSLKISIYKENGFVFLDRMDKSSEPANQQHTSETSGDQQEEEPSKENHEVINGVLKASQPGQKGNTKFVKMAVNTGDETVNVLAHGDQTVADAQKVSQGQKVSIKIMRENGFNFFMGLVKTEEQSGQAG